MIPNGPRHTTSLLRRIVVVLALCAVVWLRAGRRGGSVSARWCVWRWSGGGRGRAVGGNLAVGLFASVIWVLVLG